MGEEKEGTAGYIKNPKITRTNKTTKQIKKLWIIIIKLDYEITKVPLGVNSNSGGLLFVFEK